MDRNRIIIAAAILGLGFTLVCGIFLALSVFMTAITYPWDSSSIEIADSTSDPSPTGTPSPTTNQDLFQSGTPTPTIFIRPSATFAVYPVAVDSWCAPWNTERTKAFVTRAITADTIEVFVNGEYSQVRYIGLEAPTAIGQREMATKKNRELVEGKTVLLIKDISDADEDGRLRRYVVSGVHFINRELLELGYAMVISTPPDITCDIVFQESQRLAQAQGLGIWGQVPSETQIPAAIFPATQTLSPGITVTPSLTQSGAQPTSTPTATVTSSQPTSTDLPYP